MTISRRDLGRRAVRPEIVQRGAQLAAGADTELDEDLAQVPFDRAHGQEQLGADLRIGVAVPGQPGDAGLLPVSAVTVSTVRAHRLTGGRSLAPAPFGER